MGLSEAGSTHRVLREVVERLAPLSRRAGSPGEAEAADWLARRLEAAGASTSVEAETYRDGYGLLHAGLAGVGLAAGLTVLAGRARRSTALAGGLVAAAIVDDVSNWARVARRASTRPRRTQNVVAEVGEPAERTLVVFAHHDAAPTGFIFDQTAQQRIAARFPERIEKTDTGLPLWWVATAGPGLVALGGLTRRRRAAILGTALCGFGVVSFGDVARNRIVPGANDNLSAVAVLVAVAERLNEEPVSGLRVLLVSCGAEEVIQGGIYGWMARHAPELPRDRTWVLNLDTVGSPRLALLEGEGPFRMEEYHDPPFRDFIVDTAARAGIALRRGLRARSSTDAVIPSRAGFPTATLVSVDYAKALSNYHLMTDTPENLDYGTVASAAGLVEAVARALSASG